MAEKQSSSSVILDRPVSHPDDDRYGFSHVAQQLAHSIKHLGQESSAVIGIEGPWGSGKTSLLNLLRNILEEKKKETTFILTISPWLDGATHSTVESLLVPVSNIIDREEKSTFLSSSAGYFG